MLPKNWQEKVLKTKETVEKIQKGEIEFFRTGFSAIDEILYGSVLPGAQFVVAGATGMGKTMVMINMALQLAKMGKRVRYFSLENSIHSIIVRMISNLSGVYVARIRRGNLDEKEIEALENAYQMLSQLDLDVYDDVFSPHEICKKIKEEKPDVFFIDYVQNLYLNDYTVSRNRTQEVGRISRMMRETAVANNAISVLGSQLSRKVDDREDKRPRNSDLRDSGELEQDADVIMLLYRDEYYYGEKSEKQGILEIAISKNREGATGYAEFIWMPETSRIEEVWMGEEYEADGIDYDEESIEEFEPQVSLDDLKDIVNF